MTDYLPIVVHLDERPGLKIAVTVYSVAGRYRDPIVVEGVNEAAKTAGRMVAGEVRRVLRGQK